MTSQYVQAIVTVLAVLNPLGNGPIFTQIVSGLAPGKQMATAARAAVAVLVILVLSAFVGQLLLEAFGISISAFRVAGGVIVAYMGFGMLQGTHSSVQRGPADEEAVSESVLVPFAMPLCAGPGTIAAVITLGTAPDDRGIPTTALVASVVGAVVLYFVLVINVKFGKHLSESAQRITMRFMGLILVAMGFEFLLHGVKEFFA